MRLGNTPEQLGIAGDELGIAGDELGIAGDGLGIIEGALVGRASRWKAIVTNFAPTL